MPGDFLIRRAEPSDAEELLVLVRELCLHQREPTDHLDLEKVRRDMTGPDCWVETFVADRGGTLIGYASFNNAYEAPYMARGLNIVDIFVVDPARGTGIGRALIAAVCATAKERQLEFVWWTSLAWNVRAQDVYTALGAEAVQVMAHTVWGDTFERLAGLAGEEAGGAE